MKRRAVLMSLLIGAMLFLAFGCKQKDDLFDYDSVTPIIEPIRSSHELSASEMAEKVRDALDSAESYHVLMTMKMDLEFLGKNQGFSVVYDISSRKDPEKTRILMNSSVFGKEKESEAFVSRAGKGYDIYTRKDGIWSVQNTSSREGADSILSKYGMVSDEGMLLKSAGEFEYLGEETLNGTPVKKVKGYIDSKEMKEILAASGFLEQLKAKIQQDALDTVVENIKKAPVILYFQEDTYYPVSITMDLKQSLGGAISKLAQSYGVTAELVKLTSSSIELTYDQINGVKDIKLPKLTAA